MNSKNIFRYVLGLLLSVTVFSTSSCDKNNDWSTESTYDSIATNRLFRPLEYSLTSIKATTIELAFTKIVGAKNYVVELSEDSLLFTNNLSRVNIKADTLQVYANSATVSRIVYRVTLSNLNSNTRYSLRLKGVGEDTSVSSLPVKLTFNTLAENIFKNISADFSSVKASWTQTNNVTHMCLVETGTSQNLLTDSLLTQDEIAKGSKTITGLKVGTYYKISIYNGVRNRGTLTFKTSGTANSYAVEVQSGDDLNALLTSLAAQNQSNVSLAFASGSSFTVTKLTVPAAITTLTLTAPSSGETPELNIENLGLPAAMDGLYFENVHLIGRSDASVQMIYINYNTIIKAISFEGCTIESYNCLLRLAKPSTGNAIVNKLTVNNCIVSNIGSYGFINLNSSSTSNATLGEFNLSNSTLTKIKATYFADIRIPTQISILNCTFYSDSASSKIVTFFNVDKYAYATTFGIDRCIFSGKNGSQAMKATGYKTGTSGAPVISFGGSYITSELGQDTSYPFTDITTYTGSAKVLFDDPDNGVFTIKTDAAFAGEGNAGDPRWYKSE